MSPPEVIEVALADRPYPVLVGEGWLEQLADQVSLPAGARRALLVTQQGVLDAGHVDPVEASLRAGGLEVHRALVADGEVAKNADSLIALWHRAADAGLSRADLVVAVGGGVIGDLAGFVAATYNRGVAVLQVPTTLLAQVDAAIGGKTGINLPAGKNLVGAFHQPLAVACDVTTLATLPSRMLVEGLGEVVKYGLIDDPVVLERLEGSADLVLAGEPGVLRELVARSVAVKAAIVAADEREAGVRAHLNLGHTYGHAVEALTGYGTVLHGEAVAIGMVVALRLGVRLGRTPPALAERAEAVLRRLGLPTEGPVLERADVWDAMGRDKKAVAEGVRFVVLDGLAAPVVVTPDRAVVDEVLDEVAAR
jgi:3-dehydroquinate synthase